MIVGISLLQGLQDPLSSQVVGLGPLKFAGELSNYLGQWYLYLFIVNSFPPSYVSDACMCG